MAVLVGTKAPEFELPVTTGSTFSLFGTLSASPGGVIVAFFPLAFTPG
jgi:peroxiredoxin